MHFLLIKIKHFCLGDKIISSIIIDTLIAITRLKVCLAS